MEVDVDRDIILISVRYGQKGIEFDLLYRPVIVVAFLDGLDSF